MDGADGMQSLKYTVHVSQNGNKKHQAGLALVFDKSQPPVGLNNRLNVCQEDLKLLTLLNYLLSCLPPSVVLPWCYLRVPMVLPLCIHGVIMVLSWCYQVLPCKTCISQTHQKRD